jgi:ATP-dependent Zn protease
MLFLLSLLIAFDQVAGISAAKQEVSELVDMLTNPTR